MTKRLTVLFVDDELNVLSSLKRGLIDEDYRCIFANSGQRALELMASDDVAVIVSDMRMPEMDGLKLLKEVEDRYPKTIKIVLSGYAQLTQVIATINQVDIFKFITKPWKLEEEFKGVIQKALDYYRIQRENEEFREALGIKNKTYVNMLKNITDTINAAKNSSEIIANCGKRILSFNHINFTSVKNNCEDLPEIQQWIFEVVAKAALDEARELDQQAIIDELQYNIETIVPVINFDVKKRFQVTTKFSKAMLNAIILSYITLFKSTLKTYGLYITANMNAENQATISIVTPSVAIDDEERFKKMERMINTKISFFDCVISQMADLIQSTFEISWKQGNIVAVLTFINPTEN